MNLFESNARRQLRRRIRNSLLLAPLSFACAAAANAEQPAPEPSYATVESGHSAMWYDPVRSGEGWMLEILPDDAAVLYWFTFDDQGNPRWLGGAGEVVRGENGDEVRFDSLFAVHGPRFGPDYDPEDVQRDDVGSATFRFLDCDSGEISFSAWDHEVSYPITRLTRTMGADGCRPLHGTPGQPVQPWAGQSGSWFDPEFSGQGFTLEWMADGNAALVWFTFDPQGRPYWLTGIGQREDGRVVFPELLAVHGGRFSDEFDAADVVRSSWGSMELELECDTGQASYNPGVAGFSEGQFQLRRLTRLASPACPWVTPRLMDLYDVAITPLPIEWPSGMLEIGVLPPGVVAAKGERISVHGVANDGSVVGTAIGYAGFDAPVYYPVLLPAGATQWSNVVPISPQHELPAVVDGGIFISADGAAVLISPLDGGLLRVRGEDVSPLEGDVLAGWPHRAYGVSRDLSQVVGTVMTPGPVDEGFAKPWVWHVGTAQVALPLTVAASSPVPQCVSDNGSVVTGSQAFHSTQVALQWRGDGKPQLLRDAQERYLGSVGGCSSDGQTLFGNEAWQGFDGGGFPMVGSDIPWFWTADGRSGDIGELVSEEEPDGWLQWIQGVSADGSMAVGGYHSPNMTHVLEHGLPVSDGLIWTQDTGHVRIVELLAEMEQVLDWPTMHVAAISPNGEYLLLTTGEYHEASHLARPLVKSALLRLTRK